MTPAITTDQRFELDLLGSVELRRSDGTTVGIIAQPKRLAILSYLAIARPHGFHQRDKLLALFWPEMDQDRARAALSQAIYTLRRALGNETVITRSAADCAIAPGAIRTDVAAFESAITCGEREKAITLYRGELLEGFHVTGTAGFEEWLEHERGRLRDMARKAAWQLSSDARAAGDPAGAAAWGRRAFALAPYDEGELRQLLQVMDDAGDVAGAARSYQDFTRWLSTEMERQPAAETRELLERVLNRQRAQVARVAPQPIATTVEDATHATQATHDEPPREKPRHAHRRTIAVVAAIGVAISLVLIAGSFMRTSPASDANHIAVLPFTVRGPGEYAYLSQGIVTLLSAGLDGAGTTTVVDPQAILSFVDQRRDNTLDAEEGKVLAARFGAGSFVVGDIVAAGTSINITARLFSGDGRQAALASVVAHREADILAVVDTLARMILSQRMRSPAQRLEKVGLLATPSFAAAKAYLDGESHYRNARYEQAFDGYRRAIALDSTFAIAHYRLAIVADWVNATEVITPSLDRALKYSERADSHERKLIQALALFWRAGTMEADTAYASLLRSYPDDIDAWYQYGELLFHQGLYLGRSLRAAEDPFRRVIALQPDHQAALAHLMRIAARTGRPELVDSLGRRIDRITPNMERTPEIPLLRAYALRDSVAIEKNITLISQQPDYPVWVAAWRIGAYAGDMKGALRIIQSDMRTERGQQYRAAAHLSAAHFEAARGRFRAADSLTLQAAALDAEGALRTRAFITSLPFAPLDRPRAAALRSELSVGVAQTPVLRSPVRAHLSDPHLRLVLLSLLSARMGDTAAARAWRAAAHAHVTASVPENFDSAMRGAIASAGSDKSEKNAALAGWALQRQSLLSTPRSAGFTYAFENYIRAGLFAEMGREAEALAWYDAFGNDFGYDVTFFAPAALQRGRILDRRGDRAAAAREYAQFITLWEDADAELQPQVAAARVRLRRLQLP